MAQVGHHRLIPVNRHPYAIKIVGNLGCQLLRIDEKRSVVVSYEQICHKDRVAMHIRATHVECPCYVVEGADEQGVNSFGGHLLPYPGDFAFCRLTCIF